MSNEKKYIFGPVPSRRLGLSLGVDVVPYKVCTLDCVYCQVGRTTDKTIVRKEYVSAKAVLAELKQRLDEGVLADVITLSGSGEPTLNSSIGQIIKGIKKLTDIKVALLTNGTLFSDATVRAECACADIVLPSLDAAGEEAFEKINRPFSDIDVEQMIEGLCKFRQEYSGQIWLEVFLVEGINTDQAELSRINSAIGRIRPDKVHLNTAVRPTADEGISRISIEKMESIAAFLGSGCEIVADFTLSSQETDIKVKAEDVLGMLKRRPCSVEDICAGLQIGQNEALKYVGHFTNEGIIVAEKKGEVLFYKAV